MKRILIIFGALVANVASAQQPEFLWARQNSGERKSDALDITLDSNGNLYQLGYFVGPTNADPDNSNFTLAGHGISFSDFYISKYGSNGDFIWAKEFGGELPDGAMSILTPPISEPYLGAGALVSDPFGNIYITTIFSSDSVDMDPSSDSYYVYLAQPDSGSFIHFDYLVGKLDSNGNLVWAHAFGGVEDERVEDLVTDPNGNVVILGSFRGEVDFSTTPGQPELLVSNNGVSGFIQRLDSDGALVSVQLFESDSGYAIPTQLAFDADGNQYFLGEFEGTVDFDLGSGVFEMTNANDSLNDSIFLVKLDSNGEFVWVRQMFGNGAGFMTIDNDIVMCRQFSHFNQELTIDVDPSPTGEFLISSEADGDNLYLLKLDKDGYFLNAGVVNRGFGFGIASSLDQGYIIAMEINDTLDIDPGPAVQALDQPSDQIPFPYASVTMVIGVDSQFNLVWHKVIGSLKPNANETLALITDESNNLFISSGFRGTVDLDPSPTESFEVIQTSANYNNYDVFALKWTLPAIPVSLPQQLYSSLLIYPNPSNGLFNVFLPDRLGPFSYTLIDQFGRIIEEQIGVVANQVLLKLDAVGLYHLCITSAKSETQCTKIIVK